MPFAYYKDFDDCIAQNQDKIDPATIARKLKAKLKKNV